MKNLLLFAIAAVLSACVSTGQYEVCESNLKKSQNQVKELTPTPTDIELQEIYEKESEAVIQIASKWGSGFVDAAKKEAGVPIELYIHSVGFAGDFSAAVVGVIVNSIVTGQVGFFLLIMKDTNGKWGNITTHFPMPAPKQAKKPDNYTL